MQGGLHYENTGRLPRSPAAHVNSQKQSSVLCSTPEIKFLLFILEANSWEWTWLGLEAPQVSAMKRETRELRLCKRVIIVRDQGPKPGKKLGPEEQEDCCVISEPLPLLPVTKCWLSSRHQASF